jgi:hypothetical protein
MIMKIHIFRCKRSCEKVKESNIKLASYDMLESIKWTVTLGKILTLDNLRKRGIIVVGWCCMCKQSGESINHLLLHCEVVRALWSVLFTIFNVTWVMFGGVANLLAC